MKVVNALYMLMQIEAVSKKANEAGYEVKTKNSVFLYVGKIGHDRVVTFDEMRILKTKPNFSDENKSIGTNEKTYKGISFHIFLVSCLV